MNTADRSIALVDAALRRRFWFQGFFPDEPPIEGLLRRWLEDRQPGAEWVADLVDLANERLGERAAAIGPSYFMGGEDAPPLDEKRVERIWNRAVIHYVGEQLFGDDEKLAALKYDALKRTLAAGDEARAEDEPDGEADADADAP